VGLPSGALRGKGSRGLGPSERVVHLFMTEVTLDQTMGNCDHFIKPIHFIKNLLTAGKSLSEVSYIILFIFVGGWGYGPRLNSASNRNEHQKSSRGEMCALRIS
jgi:hypothetical protein